MTEYITRENGQFKSFLSSEIDVGLIDLLKNDYEYIYDSVIDEEYVIEYTNFNTFFEIVYEGKVVGFYTTETIIDPSIQICINEFYVLPEFRGNQIFLYHIINFLQTPNIKILIRKPSKIVIDILINGGLAYKFSEDLVFSFVNFANELGSVFVNNKVKKLYHTIEAKYLGIKMLGNVFDYKYCATVFNDTSDLFSKKTTTPCLAMPRRSDVKQYNLMPKFRKIDIKYIKKIEKEMKNSQGEVYEVSKRIYQNVYGALTVENLIGTDEKLNNYIIDWLKENNLSEEDGFKIKDKVEEALNENQIIPKTIRRRLEYLLKNPEKEALTTEIATGTECPYCGKNHEIDIETCETCGYNFYLSTEEEVEELPQRQIDEETGLEKEFSDSIDTDKYDPKEVYDAQFEIACNELLSYVDIYPNESIPINFEELHHILDNVIIKYLLENNLLEQKENKQSKEDEYVYKITKKGRRHYKQNKITNLFSSGLHGFDYYEFKKYYQENIENNKGEEILENYITQKETAAINDEDYTTYNQILINNIAMSRNIEGDEGLFIALIKSIICQLNEYKLKIDNNENELMPLRFELENFITLFDIIKEDYNLDELYEKAYNQIELESLKINKEEDLAVVKQLAETQDLFKVNLDIIESYQDE